MSDLFYMSDLSWFLLGFFVCCGLSVLLYFLVFVSEAQEDKFYLIEYFKFDSANKKYIGIERVKNLKFKKNYVKFVNTDNICERVNYVYFISSIKEEQ